MTRTTQDAPTDGPSVTADTITDEQIRELQRIGSTPLTGNGVEYACHVALSPPPHLENCESVNAVKHSGCICAAPYRRARARCAAAWNARTGATP